MVKKEPPRSLVVEPVRPAALRRALLPVGLVVGASLVASGALLLALRDDGTCATATPAYPGGSPAFERVKRLFVRPTPPPGAVAGGMMAPSLPPTAPATVVGPPAPPTVAGPPPKAPRSAH